MSSRCLVIACCVLGACGSQAAPTSAAREPAGRGCPEGQVAVIEPGCEEPARTRCEIASGSLPVETEWCGCDGSTLQSGSEAPPPGARYRHEGPCGASAELRAVPVGDPDADPPRARIVLRYGSGTEMDVGTAVSGCSHVDRPEGALDALTCFHAGAWDRFSVRQEGRQLIVSQQSGDEETDPGPWTELTRVELAEGIELTARPAE